MARITIDIDTTIEEDVRDVAKIIEGVVGLLTAQSLVEVTIYPYDRHDTRAQAIVEEVIADYADNLPEAEEFEQNALVWKDLLRDAAAAGLNGKAVTFART